LPPPASGMFSVYSSQEEQLPDPHDWAGLAAASASASRTGR